MPSDHIETLAVLRAQGFVVLPQVIEPVLVDALTAALEALEAAAAPSRPAGRFEGRRTLRVHNLLAKGAPFEALAVAPRVLDVVERVLDRDCLLSAMASMCLLPGEVAQPIHADDFAVRLPKPHPVPLVCTAMVALTEFTEANGATRVVPGSHRRDSSPDWSDLVADQRRRAESVPVELAPGDAVLYVGSLWHGAGANSTDRPRRGVATSYCAGWVRPQENQWLGVPPERVAGFGDRLRRLVGYGVYNGQIGHVDRVRPARAFLPPPPGERAEDQPMWDDPLDKPLERWDGV